jgi:hypothetical protein
MSERFERILELCAALGDVAENLESARGRAPPLYPAIEPLYRELEGCIQAAGPELIGRAAADPRLRAAAPDLHRLRAAYEYDKEAARARAILDGPGGPARLARFLDDEAYWALGPELRAALSGRRHVLVAGSGSLPLTALGIVSELGARVTAVECDAEAFALGRRVIEHAGYGDRISGIEADLAELAPLDAYDAIVGAVLLGVDGRAGARNCKSEIAEQLLARLRPNTSLILRDPHGLGQLLYAPLNLTACSDIEVTRHVPESGPGVPYRSALVVARRLGLEIHDANPSALRVYP